jgi:hypothetical protein
LLSGNAFEVVLPSKTNADPAGTIADAICQRENAMALASEWKN